MTDDELLATCIADEAANQPYEGKVAVGRVVRNRMAALYESDGTVAGTVLKHFQFSGFWFAMVAGHYKQTEFDLAGAEAEAQRLFDGFRASPALWQDCLRAVEDSKIGSGFAGGPEWQKIDAEPRTLMYVNLAVCDPAWASPEREIAKVYAHTFYSA